MAWVAMKIGMDQEVLTIGGQDYKQAIHQARAGKGSSGSAYFCQPAWNWPKALPRSLKAPCQQWGRSLKPSAI
jgi:hypothetical protein